MKKSANKKSVNHSPNKETHQKQEKQKDHIEELKDNNVQEGFILYKILGLTKEASQEEIKKSYRKLALLTHPDKNPDDKQAAENFQKLQKAYSILSDPKKKERYDRFGDEDDEDGLFTTDDWLDAYEYYRAMHPEIKKDDVKSFTEKYRFSEEEQEDLLDFYQDHAGNIKQILENIMCCTNDDIERFVKFYEDKIKEGVIERTKRFDSSKNNIKLLPDEAAEAKKMKKQKQEQDKKKQNKQGSMEDLEKMILAKQNKAFGGFLNYMESKYGNLDEEEQDDDGKNKSKKRKKNMQPDDGVAKKKMKK